MFQNNLILLIFLGGEVLSRLKYLLDLLDFISYYLMLIFFQRNWNIF